MSLADELMNDLDGSDGEEEQTVASSSKSTAGSMLPPAIPSKRKAADDLEDLMEGDEDEEGADEGVTEAGVAANEKLEQDEVEAMELGQVEDVKKVAKLWESSKLSSIREEIIHFTENPTPPDLTGPVEENPEYNLIVSANNLSVDVENELMIVHKFIRDHYSPRFPELESLVPAPDTYISTVLALGNTSSLTESLQSSALVGVLPAAIVMAVSMTASTSRGRVLTAAEWRAVEGGITVAKGLRESRDLIFTYVESRMMLLAPNLSSIVGTSTAAKLLGVAGGLTIFAKTPSCNVYLFGANKNKNNATGLGRMSQGKNQGYVYSSPIVQSVGAEYRLKAQRTVGAKCVLAARMDLERTYRDGSYGQQLLTQIQAHLKKLSEPPPSKVTKALPRPDEEKKKRRGGKRARAQKEQFAQTELRKLQNRLQFGVEGEEEAGYGDETIGMGMIGANSGRVRAEAVDNKSKAKLSKANKLRTQLLGRSAASSDSLGSGTATSLSFTPVQGLEITTPSLSAQARVADANKRWFASGTFSHVAGSGLGSGASGVLGKKEP